MYLMEDVETEIWFSRGPRDLSIWGYVSKWITVDLLTEPYVLRLVGTIHDHCVTTCPVHTYDSFGHTVVSLVPRRGAGRLI